MKKSKTRKIQSYTVIIEPCEEGGFWARVPALPGCHTQGETMEEIVAMAKEAIECYIDSLLEHNEPVPVEKKPIKYSTIDLPIMLPERV